VSNVDAAIVFLPRWTTLVGASSFSSLPLDCTRFGSAQFQLWRGPLRGTDSPTFLAYLEESLDAQNWVLGPSTPTGYDPASDDPTLVRPKLFSYGFRLRWFRVRVVLGGTDPVVTCWAEGLLRDGGGGGAWVQAAPPVAAPPPRTLAPAASVSLGGPPTVPGAAADPPRSAEFREFLQQQGQQIPNVGK
jgi:hypothetical protein